MTATAPKKVTWPRTARPQRKKLKNGPDGFYTKLPNEFLNHLMSRDLLSGKTQIYAVILILHHTWGAEGRPEWAPLSLTQMAEACGNMERMNLARALADLEKRHIIETKARKGCTDVTLYRITPQKWKDALPYEPEPAHEQNSPNPNLPRGDKLIVRPGAKPSILAHLEPPDREPLDFGIQFANTGPEPIEISAITEADVLRITVHQNPSKTGEETAHAIGVHTYKQKANTVANNRLVKNEYGEFLTNLLFNVWGVALDSAFLAQAVEIAGEMPVECLERRLTLRFGKKYPAKLQENSPGLLLSIIGDARVDYNANRIRPNAPERPQDPNQCPRCKGTGKHSLIYGDPCPDCQGTGKAAE